MEISSKIARKSTIFPTPCVFNAPAERVPLELGIGVGSEETRMMRLPDGQKSFKIGLFVLIQYRRVTDTQPASHVAVASTRYAYLHHAVKTQLFTGQMHFLLPTQQCQSTEGKNIFHGRTSSPQARLGSSKFQLRPLQAPGYLVGGLPCLSSALWLQYRELKEE